MIGDCFCSAPVATRQLARLGRRPSLPNVRLIHFCFCHGLCRQLCGLDKNMPVVSGGSAAAHRQCQFCAHGFTQPLSHAKRAILIHPVYCSIIANYWKYEYRKARSLRTYRRFDSAGASASGGAACGAQRLAGPAGPEKHN
jgi:hypothetical protein